MLIPLQPTAIPVRPNATMRKLEPLVQVPASSPAVADLRSSSSEGPLSRIQPELRQKPAFEPLPAPVATARLPEDRAAKVGYELSPLC